MGWSVEVIAISRSYAPSMRQNVAQVLRVSQGGRTVGATSACYPQTISAQSANCVSPCICAHEIAAEAVAPLIVASARVAARWGADRRAFDDRARGVERRRLVDGLATRHRRADRATAAERGGQLA